jgi:type II secretory pathway pseudopilin PulG
MHALRSTLSRRIRRGFTLIEAAAVTVIVGVAFVSVMGLFAACTQQNRVGGNMTTAMLLAGNIQETMAGLSFNDPGYGSTYFGPEPGQTLPAYDDLDDFDNQTFNPPIDSLRQSVPTLNQFTQSVTVAPVYSMQLSSNPDPAAPAMPKTTYTGAVRVTVRVLYKVAASTPSVEVYRTSWIRVNQ